MKTIHSLKSELSLAEVDSQSARQNYMDVLEKIERQQNEIPNDVDSRRILSNRLRNGQITLETFERDFNKPIYQPKVDYESVRIALKLELRARETEEGIVRVALYRAIEAKAGEAIAKESSALTPALLKMFSEWMAALQETRQQFTYEQFFYSEILPVIKQNDVTVNAKIATIRKGYAGA